MGWGKILFLFIKGALVVAGLSCVRLPQSRESASSVQGLASCPLRPGLRAYPQVIAPSKVLPNRPSQNAFVVHRSAGLPKAFSKESTLFGVEMEFPVVDGLREEEARKSFSKKLKEKCDQCPGLCQTDRSDFVLLKDDQKSPSSLFLYVSKDPAVIEVQTPPLTYAQTQSWKGEIESLIFATAKELRNEGVLKSSDSERNRWSGHINISWPGLSDIYSYPDEDSMHLMLNYFIDSQNFPELGMGVLGGDVRNARFLALGSKEDQDRLQTVITQYQKGHYLEIQPLAQALYRVVPESFQGGFNDYRYVPVNLENIVALDSRWGYEKGMRLELRSFFAPLSVDEILAHFRIINSRLDYLHQNYRVKDRHLVEYKPPIIDEKYKQNARLFYNDKPHGLVGGITPAAAAKAYIRYLKEAGLDPLRESHFLRDRIVQRAVKNQLECKSTGNL